MYIETSQNSSGSEKIFVSFERTDNIQITNITFYYNRFSILNNNSLKLMSCFGNQLLLKDYTWNTKFIISKISDSSTNWTLAALNFAVENYGIKLIYNQLDTPHAGMSYSNMTKTHSSY